MAGRRCLPSCQPFSLPPRRSTKSPTSLHTSSGPRPRPRKRFGLVLASMSTHVPAASGMGCLRGRALARPLTQIRVRPVRNVNLHIAKLTLFNLLSGADLLLTWRLIRRGQGIVYECNPIASAWLSSFGWAGLVAFKLAMMATIGFLAILISVRHPKVSGRILLFGCLVTAAVVIYSCYLTHLIGVEFADIWDDDTRALISPVERGP
jgi:Domain of unknown function (DUF5658)